MTTMKIVKLKSMGGSGRTTIERLEIESVLGDKVSAALARLGRTMRATARAVSLDEFRRRRRCP
jgi:hypothetical protein